MKHVKLMVLTKKTDKTYLLINSIVSTKIQLKPGFELTEFKNYLGQNHMSFRENQRPTIVSSNL